MANSSDWIAAAGRAAEVGAAVATVKDQPGWIGALGLSEPAAPGGFREFSPFGAGALTPDPAVASTRDSAPEPAPDQAPEPAPSTETTDQVSPEEEAYMRGYAEGHADAKRGGDGELASEQARYRELRMAFRALDAAALDALAQDLNATVLALCEQVLGEYAADHEALVARCHAAAKRLGAGPRDLTLHLNPATHDRLDKDALAGWTLNPDPTLAPGALRVTSADGAVREGPEDWMRAFAEALGA